MNEEFEKMRAEFEAHMFSTGLVWDNSREDDGDGDEQYADVETRVNWGVWQAAWQASRKQAIEECAKVCDELSREASDNGYSLSETWAHVVRNIKNRDAYRGSHEEGTVVKHYNEPGPLPYAKAAYAIRGLQKE